MDPGDEDENFSAHSVNGSTEGNHVLDEYGFPVDGRFHQDYHSFSERHTEKQKRVQSHWKDVKLTTTTSKSKLRSLVQKGVPKESRPLFWLLASGALKKRESANSNAESGSYYQDLVEKNKKATEAGKPVAAAYEIEKDIARTFPGHSVVDSLEGQEKLKRILEAFARRNKALGYCQSMNFLAAWAMLHTEEEDAFWILTTIVEDLCPGIWSRTMVNIQVDSEVLKDLLHEKNPVLFAHVEKLHLSLLLITTKWFMCIFLSYLPSETAIQLWDRFMLEGMSVLFRAALCIMALCQDELLQTKDSIKFCRILEVKALSLFDYKVLKKAIDKMSDIDEQKLDEVRAKQRAYFREGMTEEQMQAIRQQLSEAQQANTSGIYTQVSSTYKHLSEKLDFWYKRGKNKYNNYVHKKAVQAEVASTSKSGDLDAALMAKLFQCSADLKQSIDSIQQGIGLRLYPDGHKYSGNFRKGKREGYGVLTEASGGAASTPPLVEYDGYWKNDKRDGNGTSLEHNGNTYKGDWKNDEYYGKGTFKCSTHDYTGEWKHGKHEGRGVFLSHQNGERYDGEWKHGKHDGRGIMIFSNGDKYDGDWKDGRQEGRGVYTFNNSERYDGEFKSNRQEGRGTMTFLSGDRYEGHWSSNKQEGRGVMTYANGDRYDGNWTNNVQDGRGSMTYANGDKYEGEWRNAKREGKGVFTFANGDRLEGFWQNHRMEGRGTLTFPNGDKYEGDFKGGKRDGKGVQSFVSGDRYEGDWRNDAREGRGLYIWADGAQYEGEWKSGKKSGKGTLVLANGDKYTGDWRDGKREGRGVMLFQSKANQFEGEWRDGRQEGYGVMRYGNGQIYEGQWKANRMHGRGTYTFLDGTKFEGTFEDGYRIQNGVKYWPDGELVDEDPANPGQHSTDHFTMISKLNMTLSQDGTTSHTEQENGIKDSSNLLISPRERSFSGGSMQSSAWREEATPAHPPHQELRKEPSTSSTTASTSSTSSGLRKNAPMKSAIQDILKKNVNARK
eukprot:TRINITY_DN6715_c0_g1_i1.p1 TRINITY_DN6715_c0_g1~~TRINITY_DN6715_c0_g1_i1.p1  ORF type:complete len:1006 (+),score=276.52 TRINITY_DN6715_c0_g1_i1:184-3201(+)